MYSRNRWRDSRIGSGEDEEGREVGMSREEYELYRYNIPPRYDGSRFRRSGRNNYPSDRVIEVLPETVKEDEPQVITDESKEETVVSAEECVEVSCETQQTHTGGIEGILSRLGDKLGSEELLLVSLILTIAGGEDSGEMLLLLILLLLYG